MVDLRLHYGGAALCVAATLLAGCGGSQPLIGNPGAIPPGRAITQQAAHVPMRERSGQSFSVAYSFRGQSDGAQPQGNLIFDTSGALLGTTQYWDSTAIFVFWDDWGGWYDPEPPAYVDYDGLGIRVPMIVISAYAKKGHVSHVPYEHGSILKFVEDQFGLGRLAASDTRATSPEQDCFNFNQSPRQLTPISSPRDKAYFLHQPSDYRLPGDE
jgi:hypothetical protein